MFTVMGDGLDGDMDDEDDDDDNFLATVVDI
jgi:hypothetical protein